MRACISFQPEPYGRMPSIIETTKARQKNMTGGMSMVLHICEWHEATGDRLGLVNSANQLLIEQNMCNEHRSFTGRAYSQELIKLGRNPF